VARASRIPADTVNVHDRTILETVALRSSCNARSYVVPWTSWARKCEPVSSERSCEIRRAESVLFANPRAEIISYARVTVPVAIRKEG